MKLKNLLIIGIMSLAGLLCFISCSKDDEKKVDEIVGTYAFTSAEFNDAVTITIQDYPVEFASGSDASQFVGPAILGAAPCDNPENAAVDLRANGTAFYVCVTEVNEEQAGTWTINDDRTILYISISNPQAFALTINELVVSSTLFTGTVTNFPLPLDTAYQIGDLIPDVGLNYQTASVDVTFTKVPE